MNYTDIINQVVAEAIDREVENRLAAKNGEIAHLKELLAERDKEIVRRVDEINELKSKNLSNSILGGEAITRTYGTGLMSAAHVQQDDVANLKGQVEKKDKELVALRGDVLKKEGTINSLQAELNGVRGALKNHVDSEEKLKKELYNADERINNLATEVDKRDTRIEELEGVIEEKDDLIGKYKDMADAISDWANDGMPSLEPDDY